MKNFSDPDLTVELPELESSFVRTVDLIGRAFIVVPKEFREEEGTQIDEKTGKPKRWQYVESDVVILTGLETEKIPTTPFTVENMRLSGTWLVPPLKKMLERGPKQAVLQLRLDEKAYKFGTLPDKFKASKATQDAWAAYEAGNGSATSDGSQDAAPPF